MKLLLISFFIFSYGCKEKSHINNHMKKDLLIENNEETEELTFKIDSYYKTIIIKPRYFKSIKINGEVDLDYQSIDNVKKKKKDFFQLGQLYNSCEFKKYNKLKSSLKIINNFTISNFFNLSVNSMKVSFSELNYLIDKERSNRDLANDLYLELKLKPIYSKKIIIGIKPEKDCPDITYDIWDLEKYKIEKAYQYININFILQQGTK